MQAPTRCDVMQQSHWLYDLDSGKDEDERMEVVERVACKKDWCISWMCEGDKLCAF